MFMRPMFRIVPDHTTIRFMRGRFMGLIVSAILSTASVVLFFYPGLNLGIDFSGGVVMEVRTPGPADFAQIRTALAQEHILELNHAGSGEQQSRIIARHQGTGGHYGMSAVAEELQEGLTNVRNACRGRFTQDGSSDSKSGPRADRT